MDHPKRSRGEPRMRFVSYPVEFTAMEEKLLGGNCSGAKTTMQWYSNAFVRRELPSGGFVGNLPNSLRKGVTLYDAGGRAILDWPKHTGEPHRVLTLWQRLPEAVALALIGRPLSELTDASEFPLNRLIHAVEIGGGGDIIRIVLEDE